MQLNSQFHSYRWPVGHQVAVWLLIACGAAAHASPPPKTARVPVSVVGLVARTHAVRRPTPGGFGDSLEFTFVRFLEGELRDRELTINYAFEWITAMPQDFGRGRELLQRQALTFPAPTAIDRKRGYQFSSVTLKIAADNREGLTELNGQQFWVKTLPSHDGSYVTVSEDGRLIREINRRWAKQSALCRIYEGCVISCLPHDRARSTEPHPLDPHDLDQAVPNCYLMAALVAAVRRDPEQLHSLISQTTEGYIVTFPGQGPIKVPLDIDRGPDMVDSRVFDVDAQGNVEIWPVLLERAFAILNSQLKPNCAGAGQEFLDVADGDSQQAYHILTGRPVVECTRWQFSTRSAQLHAINQHLQSTRPVMMTTGKWTDSGDRPYWWREDHVYVVTAVGTNGKTLSIIDPGCGQSVERIKIGDWFDSTEVKRFLLCD